MRRLPRLLAGRSSPTGQSPQELRETTALHPPCDRATQSIGVVVTPPHRRLPITRVIGIDEASRAAARGRLRALRYRSEAAVVIIDLAEHLHADRVGRIVGLRARRSGDWHR